MTDTLTGDACGIDGADTPCGQPVTGLTRRGGLGTAHAHGQPLARQTRPEHAREHETGRRPQKERDMSWLDEQRELDAAQDAATPIRVEDLGSVVGGSYGYGHPPGMVRLWLVRCPAQAAYARQHPGVGSIAPWVYPSRRAAREAAARARAQARR